MTLPFSTISIATLQQMRKASSELVLLDVRTTAEHQQLGYIPDAILMPLDELPYAYRMLDPNMPVVVMCQHGVRSIDACYFLASQGFKTLYNLDVGFSGWTGEVHHTISGDSTS